MLLKTRALLVFLAVALVLPPLTTPSTLSASPLAIGSADASPAPAGLPEVLAALFVVGMALRVKDAATTARKWVTRAAAASGDYKAGVAQAGGDWEANALAGKQNYADGVNQAIGDNRFERGIRAAGGAKFAQRAAEIGATRFGPGVQASEGEFAKGVGPVLQAIAALNLPPRRPKGDPGNMERANYVATQLRKLKTAR